MPISRMPFFSASSIHPPYRRRDIGSPGSTRIGFPSGSPAISRQSSRPPPTGTVLVSTSLDTKSLPLAGSGEELGGAGAVDAADHDWRLSLADARQRHWVSAPAVLRNRAGPDRAYNHQN